MVITWSKINFLGSGGKQNVEESVRIVIMTTLRVKGGKKVGKVGNFMKVEVHMCVDFNSDCYKVATNKLEIAMWCRGSTVGNRKCQPRTGV